MNRNGFRSAVFSLLVAALPATYAQTAAAAQHFTDGDQQEIRTLFLRQAHAATTHDLTEFASVFVSSSPGESDPVALVARPYRIWGRTALLDHFRETFKGVWKFEPETGNIKILPLSDDVAQLYAPALITSGKSPASATTGRFLMYEVALRTGMGWRISSIVPVPAE
ncbi:nuclear transport factor 2 family protein [Paraburkholderia kururiensis]|uniref:Nuclear transport factor 2 family protein n=1 Tax=Paraburkholderia kururiensis TaxID=984307 RepID=A0ABZ0WQC1_9BURK|nr:nuclear transport factor 2 family protein [Paraburkholderia kururiensis]WQD79562.1 nuclear transport factor 2 family protein [Paraburkholderia kururiensis]